jgi:hypothetical protein
MSAPRSPKPSAGLPNRRIVSRASLLVSRVCWAMSLSTQLVQLRFAADLTDAYDVVVLANSYSNAGAKPWQMVIRNSTQ